MDIRFTQSARKHRIGKQRVLFLLANNEPLTFTGEDLDEDTIVWIGKDDRGLELEVIAIRTSSGILIIHFMPLNFRKGKR